MLIKFHKLQSLGNDFIFIDRTQCSESKIFDAEFFKKISDRHFGIGCDLSVLYKIDQIVDDIVEVSATFFNPDGSESEICGNATKCMGLLVRNLTNKTKCRMFAKNRLFRIILRSKDEVSVAWDKKVTAENFDISKILQDNLLSADELKKINVTDAFYVSVGNPHLVLFVDGNLPSLETIEKIGKKIENNPIFPNKVNVNFARKIENDSIELIVFERGAGLTLACGSGALATAIAAEKYKIIARNKVKIRQRGGELQISWTENGDCIQTSPAKYVFSGQIEFENKKTSYLLSERSNNKVTIYTDGACSGNPGPGGWGFIVIDNEQVTEYFGGDPNTTNNRMELLAVINALEKTPIDCEIELYTDSQYVRNGITQWIKNWIKNGWRSSDKKNVKNKELWERLLSVSGNRKISWNWVRGHNGDKFNEQVDALARKGCEIYR